MWKHFILCFILIGSSYQITQAQVDVNSKQHVDMVWSYLQLRPEDIYTTENDTTSIKNIAALYYGDASYTPLILNANPSLEYDENFIIPTCSIEVTLPSVIKCTEFLPLDCIEKSHLLSGNPLNIAVVPKPIASAAPLEGRTLQQAGEVDYSAFEDIPQPLMEQVHDISPLNLKVDIVNRMEVPLWPRDGGRSSFLKAGSETSYTKKVSPYDVTSYTFSFVSIFQRTFFVEVSIASAPMPQFPFFHPGEATYIKFVVTNATSGNIKIYYTSPEINPTQGRVSLLTAQGLDQPSLNITLSIDAQWGKNTARVVFESYNRGYFYKFSNEIFQIAPVNNQDVRISLVTQNSDNYHTSLASQAASNFAGQAWRFIHVKESQYRILNLWTGQVLANNPAGLTLHMEDPSAESSRQIWTVLFPWNDANPGLKRFIQGKGNVCLLLNNRETTIPLLGGIRLRLAPCNMTDTNQMFTIPSTLDTDWNHTE